MTADKSFYILDKGQSDRFPLKSLQFINSFLYDDINACYPYQCNLCLKKKN